MGAFVRWYIAVEALGVLALPLSARLFARLPDGGYCFSKILAILLVGFVLWTGTAYGLLRNELGGAAMAALIVGLVSASVGSPELGQVLRGRGPLLAGLRGRLAPIVIAESLFLVSFAGWALLRAHDPDVSHTEQPMDLMFLSAVWNSPTFPPGDPWLAGYPISYYYFGYWLLAAVARLAGQPPEIAYNLGQACWFALLLVGCWGIAFNVAALRRDDRNGPRHPTPMMAGSLAVLSVVLIGNVHTLREATWAVVAPLLAQEASRPALVTSDWWWRSSRLIRDRDLLGRPIEIIDEYPLFSYLLGDNHPHLLAMPFVILVIALALALACATPNRASPQAWLQAYPGGRAGLFVIVVAAGSLLFLNPWDLPAAWGLLIVGSALAAPRRAYELMAMLIAGTAIAYFPYLLAAQGQILGIRPNLFHPTALDQLLSVFGLFVPGLVALLWLAWRQQRPRPIALVASAGTLLAGTGLWFLASTLWASGTGAGRDWLASMPTPPGSGGPLAGALARWAIGWPTLAALLTSLAVVGALLVSCWTQIGRADSSRPFGDLDRDGPLRFVLALTSAGLGLVVIPELGYVLDGFGTRMNTVFKLYYQAWLLLGLAASYGTYLALRAQGWVRAVGALSLTLLGAGAIFPLVTLAPRFEASRPLTLDGLAHLQTADADEFAAIQWVRDNTRPDSLVLQAVGASYEPADGRLSVATGRATLLGWAGHEVQWRGKGFGSQAAGRAEAARELYGEGSPAALHQLLERWQIDYVYLGPRELARYSMTPASVARLEQVMELAFRHGRVSIYRRRG